MTSEGAGTFYIIPHERDESPQELVERISKSEAEQKKRERAKKDKEISEWKQHNIVGGEGEGEEEAVLVRGDKQETEAQAQFRYAHFICKPPGVSKKVIIPRNQFSEGAIQEHLESCPYCIEKREEKKRAEEERLEGPKQVQYCIYMISQARQDIESAKRKIQEQRARTDLQGWQRDWMIRDIRVRELEPAEFQLRNEEAELKKLLNHENPIIKQGAREEYKKYLDRRKKKNSFHQS